MYHQGRTKENSSTKVISTYEMSRTSSESALTACSEGVYRPKKASRSSSDATHHHMEDTMEHSALIRRSGKVNSFGQPCMKIRRTLFGDVERVRSTGISIKEMPCRLATTSRSRSLMSRELTTWDHLQSQKAISTSWRQLTMSPSGLKPCHVELLMQRTPRRCLNK